MAAPVATARTPVKPRFSIAWLFPSASALSTAARAAFLSPAVGNLRLMCSFIGSPS